MANGDYFPIYWLNGRAHILAPEDLLNKKEAELEYWIHDKNLSLLTINCLLLSWFVYTYVNIWRRIHVSRSNHVHEYIFFWFMIIMNYEIAIFVESSTQEAL